MRSFRGDGVVSGRLISVKPKMIDRRGYHLAYSPLSDWMLELDKQIKRILEDTITQNANISTRFLPLAGPADGLWASSFPNRQSPRQNGTTPSIPWTGFGHASKHIRDQSCQLSPRDFHPLPPPLSFYLQRDRNQASFLNSEWDNKRRGLDFGMGAPTTCPDIL